MDEGLFAWTGFGEFWVWGCWRVRGLPKGKPWSVDEERRLGELLKFGVSIREAARAMGKTLEGVQVKVLRSGLEVEGGVFCVATTSTTTSLPCVGLDGGGAESRSFVPVLACAWGVAHC